MILKYSFSKLGQESYRTRQEAIKATDKSAKALRSLFLISAKTTKAPKLTYFFLWLVTLVCTKKVTKDYVKYEFPLLSRLLKATTKYNSVKITDNVTGKGVN